MNAVRFHVVLDGSRTLQVPSDISITPGPAEVIVLQQAATQPIESIVPKRSLSERLARLAAELGIDTSELPRDLALNHDHYLHGLPKKGIDEQ